MIKLFLKRPDAAQGLVQKVLTAATAETDNPDIRDRAYVYWRLLSSDPEVTKSIVLSQRPPINTIIASHPPALLDELLVELSTLASVFHKPASTFLGEGRFTSDAVQKAAIEEQMQNARENPLAAAAAAAAVSGNAPPPQQNNTENLLDIDFDGAAPASLQKQPTAGGSGLEGLAGTPQRGRTPEPGGQPVQQNATDDLAGIFGNDNGPAPPQNASGLNDHLMNGFASLNMNGAGKQPPPASQQLQGQSTQPQIGQPSASQDLLDL